MKRIALLALASGMAIAAASPANAALVLSYSVNGGAITQLASDAGSPGTLSFVGTVGNFTFNTGAFGFPVTNQFDLLTQSINVKSNGQAQTLNIFISETNLPSLNGALQSSFTSNTLTNATATISSYYSAANALNGGTLLKTTAFPTPGTSTSVNAVSITGPFSLTTRYDIAFGAGQGGNFNGTANITAAVPETATWGMMIMGFGLMGGVLRRRSTKVAFA